jgi:L,D-transpeptidase ErfK/SrfK
MQKYKNILMKTGIFIITAGAYYQAAAATYQIEDNSELVGEVITFPAKYEDTFAEYGRQYHVGAYQLARANPGVDEWIPGEDTAITIPSQYILPPETRNGIVINLAELRLYYFDNVGQVHTYPVGVGKTGWSTPSAYAVVTEKTANPTWVVPKSILAEHEASGDPIPGLQVAEWGSYVRPGEHNPLGKYRLRLSLPNYLIHGTNSPIGVGRAVTHGCVRLYPDDIEALFQMVPVNTGVYITNEPIKAGWKQDELYLQVHPALDTKTLDEYKVVLMKALEQPLMNKEADIDWGLVHEMLNARTGVVQKIGQAV